MTGTLPHLMARPATGTIEEYRWKDGETVSIRARVRANGKRYRIDFGTNHQGWNRERARVELDRILAQVQRGTWQPPKREHDEPEVERDEIFHVFVSRWWAEKQHTITPSTVADYGWRLQKMLAGQLPHMRVSSIDARVIDAERNRLLGLGLGPRSVNMVLALLAQVLDDAVDYGLLVSNPARGKRRRVKEPPKRRSSLDPDMVVELLEEAGRLEREARPSDRFGRRAIVAFLALAGPRIAEALDLPRGDLDLHGGRVRLGRKTQAGLREVELTAFLQAELRDHLAAQVSLGRPTDARTPLFCTRTGGRQTESRVRKTLRQLVANVNERRERDGRVLLPAVTPHSLRRTFASLALSAGRDPRWVMAQIGHEDARFTLNVYAQVVQRQRVDRAALWLLMRFPDEPETEGFGTTNDPIGVDVDPTDATGRIG